MNTQNKERLAALQLLTVAVIWGTGFIATEYALESNLGTPMIMAVRFTVAALIMLAFSLKELKGLNKKQWLHGIGAGVFLFAGFYSQTYGQGFTSVSNCAFLTATNVIMVPFLVWAITKKRPAAKIFLLALMTLVGVGFLTFDPAEGIKFGMGDSFALLGALMFAVHIAYLGTVGSDVPAKALTEIQLAVAAALSLGTAAFSGGISPQADLGKGLVAALYLAVFSTCLCYFLQTTAQKKVAPGKAGIILCTEGLFGSLFSVLLGLEPVTAGLVIGGVFILGSVALAEKGSD